MKSMMKIFTRYVASAAGVAVILLVINFALLAGWVIQSGREADAKYHISQIADSLKKGKNGFVLTEPGQSVIGERYQWAMLLDDHGQVIWSENLPDDVSRSYTVPEAASFARWYISDYPVNVWQHKDGLFVLGSPKGSIWKHDISMPAKMLNNIPAWMIGALILNCIAAVLLALLFSFRFFRSLQPLVDGIGDLAIGRPLALPANGLLGDLGIKLNQTSTVLNQQEAALKKRDDARTAWIAGVSHDIRTPLSMVMGYASQLENNIDLPLAEREHARIIRMQSEKIKTLVSDLKLASKLEYNMQPLNPVSICLAALVRSVAADFLNSGLGGNYSIHLNIDANAQNTVLMGDEKLLRRAVCNLLNNSISHNPDGCEITITLQRNISICSITVSDNGNGFPQEVLKSLEYPEVPTELQNHGLGLTIVRQIAKAHGGTTTFFNMPKGGCSAEILLPIDFRYLKA